MTRSYENFQPTWNWVREDESDILIFQLPGFQKEQLKARLDNFGNLKISGERLIGGNKWSRFHKDFRIPEYCNTAEIQAKFQNGILHVIMPKTITRTPLKNKPTQPSPTQKPPQPTKDQNSIQQQKQTSPEPVTENRTNPTSVPSTQKKMGDKKREESQAAEKMMTQDSKRTNGFGMMGKEKDSRSPDGAETAASNAVQEKRWFQYGSEGGNLKLMLEGLQMHKLVVNVVVGMMVAVALGVGAYVAYKRFWSTQKIGV